MLCADFENRLTDYLDNTLDVTTHQAFVEHALRCPVCHDLWRGQTYFAGMRCHVGPEPGSQLEARILLSTSAGDSNGVS